MESEMKTLSPESQSQVFLSNSSGPGKEVEKIFSVEGNRIVPIKIVADIPIPTPFRGGSSYYIYTGLVKKQKPEWKKPYLCALKKSIYPEVRETNTAPLGAIVYFRFRYGTRKHTHFELERWYLVKESEEKVEEVEGGRIVTKNLVPLEQLSKELLAEIEAEIINALGAQPSDYDPVRTLYYYWIKKRVATPATPQLEALELEEQVKKLEELIKQKEQELQALREQLQQLKLKLQLEQMKMKMVE